MELLLYNQNTVCKKRIVFISDLHFDYINDNCGKGRYAPEYSKYIQQSFIDYVKRNHSDDILCLGGDFYDNPSLTLEFINELEKNKILGFFVLGNHDYWNNGKLSHEDIISVFITETAKNLFFRFLTAGIKYYVDDLCFIGDTGWTSFRRGTGNKQVTLKQFMSLPDALLVKNFDLKKIRDLHNNWINYANNILEKESKVIILTHFPMIDLTNCDKDCWWSSKTKLLKTENQWRIFGHTHKPKYFFNYDLTSQRGYKNKVVKQNTEEFYDEIKSELIKMKSERLVQIERLKLSRKARDGKKHIPTKPSNNNKIFVSKDEIEKEIETQINQYLPSDFGVLTKTSDSRNLVVPFQGIMNRFYSPKLVDNPNEISKFSNSVKKTGYKRSSANKYNFAYLAYMKQDYIKRVRKEIEGVSNAASVRIGYYYKYDIKPETLAALRSATDYLENNEILTDVRAFITAAIVTGYAFNRGIYWVENMRPINDYDIARFYLQFLTMQIYKIPFNYIDTIKRSPKDKIAFGNIELWLPVINNKQLKVEEVILALKQTPLIEHINPTGIKYSIKCEGCGTILECSKKCKIKQCLNCKTKNK